MDWYEIITKDASRELRWREMSEAEGERDFVGVDFDAGSVVATSYSQLQRSLTRAGEAS